MVAPTEMRTEVCCMTLPDSSLRARKLRDVRRLIVASPDWVARHPEVKTSHDLQATDVFGYTNLPRQRQPTFLASGRSC